MTRRSRTRAQWAGLAIGIALITSALTVGGWWLGRGLFDSQWSLTIADLMSSATDAVDTATDVVEITDDACGESITCVEAYDTAEARYYRFDSRAEAEGFAASLRDGFRSNYIVMDFAGKGDVSTVRQLWAMQHLAGTWQDYEGEFPDR